MPIWRTSPVSKQSSLTLESWKVLELPDGDRHLVGHCVENREGRVSSVVRKIDLSSLRAVTGRGRVYALRGRPGGNLDAEYVWQRWVELNAVSSWTDVTESVWEEHLTHADAAPPRKESRRAARQPR